MSIGSNASGSYSTQYIAVGWQNKNVSALSTSTFINGSGSWDCTSSNTQATYYCYYVSGGYYNKKPYLGNPAGSGSGYAITGIIGILSI